MKTYRYKPTKYLIRLCINCGIAESDIRDHTQVVNADVVVVRLWNHRRLIFTGQEIYLGFEVWSQNHKRTWRMWDSLKLT